MKLIALTGLAGFGKSTIAKHLTDKGYERVRFAGPLKNMMYALGLSEEEVEGSLKEKPCEILSGRTPRHAMQTLGTEWGRKNIYENFWIHLWKMEAEKYNMVVCDDCRFPNEANLIKSMGGKIWKVVRYQEFDTEKKHESETHALPYDHVFNNFRTIEKLLSEVDDYMRMQVDLS